MASNLSTIGFQFSNAEDFQASVIELASKTRERLSCQAGEYAIWRSRTGAEVWIHLAPADSDTDASERNILGLAPFFEGQSMVPVKVTAAIKRPGDNPLEGLLYGWVAPEGDADQGAYPLALETIDFAAHEDRPMPATWRCRISAFCRELNIHASPDTLPDIGDGNRLAPQALIPIGLFRNPDDADVDEQPPEPTALLSGIIRQHRVLENEITGRHFHWLLVESLAATFDLVADPDIVTGEIAEGKIVEAFAWMFARVID